MMNFNVGQKVRKILWLDKKNANVIWAGISILLIFLCMLVFLVGMMFVFVPVNANVEATIAKEGVILYNNSTEQNINEVNVVLKAYNAKGEVYETLEGIYVNIDPYEKKLVQLKYYIPINFNPTSFLLEVKDVIIYQETLGMYITSISSILGLLIIFSFLVILYIEAENKKIRAEKLLKEKEQEKAYDLGVIKMHESISEKIESQDWGI